MKKLFMFLAFGALVFSLAACNGEDPENGNGEPGAPTISGADDVEVGLDSDFVPMDGVTADDDVDGDITASIDVEGTVDTSEPGDYTLTYSVENSEGLSTSVDRTVTVLGVPYADGTYDFGFADEETRNTFFGAAERYLLETGKGGIPLFSNSGYIMYNTDRMDLPVDDAVPSLNWAPTYAEFLEDDEGLQIEPGVQGQPGEYTYRTGLQNSPTTMHQWEYDDADSADMITLFQDSLYYFGLNDAADNWEVKPGLASDFPQGQDLAENQYGQMTGQEFNIPIREDLEWAYHEDTDTSGFADGHENITAHDFEETYRKAMEEGWFRAVAGGGDFGNPGQRILNSREFIDGEVEWDEVGIEATDDHTLALEFEVEMDTWSVQYWLTSFVMTPINLEVYDWAEEDGGAYGTQPEYVAAHGPFVLDYWEDDVVLRFSENENFHDPDRHDFTNRVVRVIDGNDVRFQEFLEGNLDAAAVPGESYEEYAEHDQIHFIPGETTFRMMINGLQTQEAQQEQFPGSTYDPEAILGYESFKQALYFSMDREYLAHDVMITSTPQMYHFSDAYVVDPAGSGVAFRNTEEGEKVGEGLSPDTYGYSPDLAQDLAHEAIEQGVADGFYSEGDTIEMSFYFFSGSAPQEQMGAYIGEQIEDLFPHPELDIDFDISVESQDFPAIYFDYMMPGEFDMSVGGISGSTLDAASFLDVYSSDNRGGFTLNWGIDTSQPDIEVTYEVDGEEVTELWSYDGIFEALMGEVEMEAGREAE